MLNRAQRLLVIYVFTILASMDLKVGGGNVLSFSSLSRRLPWLAWAVGGDALVEFTGNDGPDVYIYGGAMSSTIWAYLSEVIPAKKSLFTSPVILFLAFYAIISFIHIFRYIRESDGKTFAEIFSSYK